jgi:TonB-dependent receptor
MNPLLSGVRCRSGRFARLLLLSSSVGLASTPALAATLRGTVSTAITGNLLEGARVELPGLGRFALTDNTGAYVFADLPEGEHVVVVSYTGLDAARQAVRLNEGTPGRADFDLRSEVYRMDPYTVADVREGAALAITAQRNAGNVKHVMSADALGAFASPGDLAIRFPGVAAGGIDDEGNVQGVSIRGQLPQHNRLTIDGVPIAVTTPLSRGFQASTMNAGMFDQIEVIKGHTPDKPVGALGGTINLVTRSPLAMTEKRRFTYSVAARIAPGFADHIKLRRDRPAHPLLNASYQEVFSVAGRERNLGVALTYSYTENVSGGFRTIRDYQNTTAQPAYLYSWATQDLINSRHQTNVSAKVDYRHSPATRLSLSLIHNRSTEPFLRTYEVTALTAQSVATLDPAGNPTGPGAILPNYSATFTQARPLPASLVRVSGSMSSTSSPTTSLNFSGQHQFKRWQADWTLGVSAARPVFGSSGGGTLVTEAAGVGWQLDRSKSDLYPTFTPVGGADPTNPGAYRPTQPLVSRGNSRKSTVRSARLNLSYLLPAFGDLRVTLKAGVDLSEQTSGINNHDRRWNYIGTAPIPPDTSIVTWMSEQTGFRVPMFETAGFFTDGEPDAALWREDRYFGATQNYINNRHISEFSGASFVMARGQWRRLGFLAGVRMETTETDGFGYTRPNFFTSAAQRAADPDEAARLEYEPTYTRISDEGGAVYPSAHFTYDFSRKVKGRASWSTSYSGAPFGMLLPAEMPDDVNRRLTINNEELKPQQSKEWDAAVEYYFDPAGHVSLGWFHKTISDNIVTGVERGTVGVGADNGYNGDYANYRIITSDNAGSAVVNGWEFSYQQQLVFLPGWARTLTVGANYTWLRTHGKYDGNLYLNSHQVAGFTPRSGNANITWRYKAFGVRARVNHSGAFTTMFNASAPARNQYREARTVTDLGFTFALRPKLQLFADLNNLTDEPLTFYRYVPSQRERTILNGTTMTVGMNGRF